ncbi:CBS domain-containing protein [Ectothiorhodospira magna]|uniref:CBS domain-containing protein n=1 Tax=Ectothiorhodospira magna TaxID=867345 RepID=A0A1H9AXX4_9GAMM|nr:CBS domain-containing protein [Ectothiorhodospira magna]SEP81606.1 CBS domain-containing protein [Ectothiorhodospira magna]
MRIQDLMTPDPLGVRPDTPIQRVARLLVKHRVNSLPVVDEGDVLVGIITSGDLTHRMADARVETRTAWWKESLYRSPLGDASSDDPNRIGGRTAGEVMTRQLLTLQPEDDMSVAARLFINHGIQALPVVVEGRLVGIVSRFDLLKCLADDPGCCNPFRADT